MGGSSISSSSSSSSDGESMPRADRRDGVSGAADLDALEAKTQEQQYKDCLPCKLVGFGAMASLAGYTLYSRAELDPHKFAARRRGMLGLSIALLSAGVYRLFQ